MCTFTLHFPYKSAASALFPPYSTRFLLFVINRSNHARLLLNISHLLHFCSNTGSRLCFDNQLEKRLFWSPLTFPGAHPISATLEPDFSLHCYNLLTKTCSEVFCDEHVGTGAAQASSSGIGTLVGRESLVIVQHSLVFFVPPSPRPAH